MIDITGFYNQEEKDTSFKTKPDILLSPNIPMPLWGLAPRTIMNKYWWDIERKKAYASTGYRCLACGIPRNSEGMLFARWLEAHEIYDIDYSARLAVFKEIVPLCKCCHLGIHTGRLTNLYGVDYDEEDCWLVLKRKKQVCGSYGVIDDRDYVVGWKDWRLKFNGELYEPVHKSYKDCMEYYKGKESKSG